MPRLAIAFGLVVSAVACGGSTAVPAASARAAATTSAASASSAAPDPATWPRMDGPDEPTLVASADGAVIELEAKLEAIESKCSNDLPDPAAVCRDPAFAELATRYQKRYAFRLDPRENQGRIDALPRLGGADVDEATVARRIGAMCEERCGVAERMTMGSRVTDAVDACVASFKAAKGATRPRYDVCNALPGAAAEQCTDRCRERHDDFVAYQANERRRPKTPQASARCFKACNAKCDPGGWCGTCTMSCKMECAMASEMSDGDDPERSDD